ncbi:hypothetical protein EIN_475970 [Entamoeba invadens IP1]|uniref:Uncharacterized protein n=1 Tax=Entamoeba invadens IP1 TaxID=370355 RepID=A0A0A1U9U3_ENTIV|nr:hypothetical protein EIN_475970 [Entamoeba invadens IP1]ELP88895.1 hypothetical protein EIN_475970 [Entamoeba invadens IP1]|eukprot:XP_004255666.1 hypothetical protein EIN_475970 [Entamoeba invadens IP1]
MLVFVLVLIAFATSHTLTIVLVTAPKQGVMSKALLRTMKDLFVAFKNMPSDVEISKFYFVKGCMDDCDFPDLEKVTQIMKVEFPNIPVITYWPHLLIKEGAYPCEWGNEYYSTHYSRLGAPVWSDQIFRKYMTVNYLFRSALHHSIKTHPTDYYLMAEDDQTYEKYTFAAIKELMERNNNTNKRCFSKIAIPRGNYGKLYTDDISNVNKYIWGAFGVLRSKSETELFLRGLKYSNYHDSEDGVAHVICRFVNRTNVELNVVSQHFGRNGKIPD